MLPSGEKKMQVFSQYNADPRPRNNIWQRNIDWNRINEKGKAVNDGNQDKNWSQSTHVYLLNMPCFIAHASAYYLCVYHLKAISPSLYEVMFYYSKLNWLLMRRAELTIKCISCSSGFFKCFKMIEKDCKQRQHELKQRAVGVIGDDGDPASGYSHLRESQHRKLHIDMCARTHTHTHVYLSAGSDTLVVNMLVS